MFPLLELLPLDLTEVPEELVKKFFSGDEGWERIAYCDRLCTIYFKAYLRGLEEVPKEKLDRGLRDVYERLIGWKEIWEQDKKGYTENFRAALSGS